MTEPTPAAAFPNDEIDMRELALALWDKRKLIASITLATLTLSILYAFFIAKPVFQSSALLIPTQNPTPDQLGAAAALFGKKATFSADVDLYQSLLTSRTVIQKLLNSPIKNLSDTARGREEPLHVVLGLDAAKPDQLGRAADGLARSIVVGGKQSGEGGILEIKFAASAPWLAQQIGNAVLEIGQEELRIVRIERSNVILTRLNVAVAEARAEWDSTARALTWFNQSNRSISLPNQRLDLARLEMEKAAKEQKYLLVRKDYELQTLERVKAAPPMMILDPANLPSRKIKPKRGLILAIGMMLGFIGSCVGVLAWRTFVVTKPKV